MKNGSLNTDTIVLQSETDTEINIQTGFYPKVINDFNVFYNGYDLYMNYSDEEIQKSVNNGLVPYIMSEINGLQNNKPFVIQGYSVLLKDQIDDTFSSNNLCPPTSNTDALEYFIIPSLGATFNQTQYACCTTDGNTVVDVTNNQSMYNGSVRLLWAAPNYGYFDNSEISKPNPNSYLTKIETDTNISQSPLHFFMEDRYSNIEEIFSIFDKSILNKFENEFLNFSKPITDIELGIETSSLYQSTSDLNAKFKNFQFLFGSLMKVEGNVDNTPIQNFFQDSINNQISGFSNKIKDFLEYDVLLKYGNPSNYKRRVFDSFLSNVVDPINFGIYQANSLPSSKGGITLTQSKASFSKEWKALETEVGFSTIPGIAYSNKGSYITDFFIDNNIAFTVENISLLAPIIKMYATQKYNDNKLNSSQFKTQLSDYITRGTTLQDVLLNGVLNKMRKDLPDQQQLPERTIQSVVDGQLSKIEIYGVFKALNDKWISGSDFKNKTLFEDMLFLDRASRNVGDTIIVDIFNLQNIINTNALNENMPVFTFLANILTRNNFVVMPLPSYLNFYSVQEVDGVITPNAEGSLEFANNMWGTFLNVDYRKSGPKMLAIYSGKPSEIVSVPDGNSYFRDDTFDMRRSSENPLLENMQGKKDWATSNKVVGFNVDIGTRNQNVFYNFQVTQDTGKATSEAIKSLLGMINQYNGRDINTQNAGLYNYYKSRSYECTVSCLGNALLQPMMYFNLRHVPMFYGPYLITDVQHNITPGNFETIVTGVRQSAYDLPVLENFLQSINKNLLTKIEAIVASKKDSPATTTKASPNSKKAAATVQKGGSEKATQNSCSSKLNSVYQKLESTPAILTEISPEKFRDEIIKNVSDPVLQTIIFGICYVRSYSESNKKFVSFGHNYATIELSENYGARKDYFSQTNYSCSEIKTTTSTQPNSQPIAIFSGIDKFIQFMRDSLQGNNKERILGPTMGLPKYYVCYWPIQNISESYYDKNKETEFKLVIETFGKGLSLARNLGLAGVTGTGQVVGLSQTTTTQSTTTTQNTTTTSTLQNPCPPPIIDSFSPTAATANNILTIKGKFLDQTTGVTVNNVLIKTGIIKNLDGTRVNVVIPKINVTIPTQDPIVVSTLYGTTTSKNKFLYNP